MSTSALQQSTTGSRVLALDVFRGITMAFMVLVSNPGSLDIYTQLDHAPWNGWTLTDVVFPSFLWIVGVSIKLSVGGRLARGAPRSSIVLQALRRAALLYVIGVFIYSIGRFDFHTLRFLGVLQRIAICYFAATLIFLWGGIRRQAACIGALLLAYWLLLRFVPVPGHGAGDLSIEGNLAHYIDRIVLGSHNYIGTGTWDPEGLLSTLPAIATTLFGLLAGGLLKTHRPLKWRCVRMALVGLILIVAGVLCSHWMPINKKLWTDSFCLLMSGIDFAVFAAFLWAVDGRGLRRGLALPLAFGQNALAIYMISEIAGAVLWSYPRRAPLHGRIFQAVFAGLGPPKLSSLLFALTFLSALSAVAWLLHRRGWILKL